MVSDVTKQDVRGCISPAVLTRNCHNMIFTSDCHNITLYNQYYSKQEGQDVWFLWGEKVLIGEI